MEGPTVAGGRAGASPHLRVAPKVVPTVGHLRWGHPNHLRWGGIVQHTIQPKSYGLREFLKGPGRALRALVYGRSRDEASYLRKPQARRATSKLPWQLRWGDLYSTTVWPESEGGGG